MLNARPGVHGYHYPRRNVTAHPEMGYRFVAPVSRCPDSPKVVGNSATLLAGLDGPLLGGSQALKTWGTLRVSGGPFPVGEGVKSLVPGGGLAARAPGESRTRLRAERTACVQTL